MNFKEKKKFACPLCHSALVFGKSKIKCKKCKQEFAVKNGIPIFLPKNLKEFKKGEALFHDNHAGEYDKSHCLNSRKVQAIHSSFLQYLDRMQKGAEIIEIGCGTGEDIIKIAEKGFRVFGCDISEKMVEKTKQKLKERKKEEKAEFFVADAEMLPFKANSFDASLIVAALHHLENPKKALNEIARITKPNGFVIIGSEPNSWPYYFKKIKHSKIGKKIVSVFRKDYNVEEVSIGDKKTFGFREKELRKMAEEAGLKVIEFEYVLFLGGFLLVLKIELPKKMEEAILAFDRMLARVPKIKKAGWHINVLLQNKKEK